MESFSDNIASAATKDKAVLAQLTYNNTKLVNTNEELVASVKKLTNEIKQLQQEINTIRRWLGRNTGRVGNPTDNIRGYGDIRHSPTVIVDSGASGLYFSPNEPVTNINPAATAIAVGTATGKVPFSTATGQLAWPNVPNTFPTTGHIMPGFNHTLLGVAPICDADCTVTFSRDAVVVRDATHRYIFT